MHMFVIKIRQRFFLNPQNKSLSPLKVYRTPISLKRIGSSSDWIWNSNWRLQPLPIISANDTWYVSGDSFSDETQNAGNTENTIAELDSQKDFLVVSH